ncbi:hypothetical protein HHK36_020195 [Tetracentron sinense]|uniref:Uncharacterized protein n=1 Tax=Tetracentron sinense TaxID=13715 RepID=A0A835D7T6_TETSI|nr:hypothetical protein HHK36_020195 [Tetracentron sinense]
MTISKLRFWGKRPISGKLKEKPINPRQHNPSSSSVDEKLENNREGKEHLTTSNWVINIKGKLDQVPRYGMDAWLNHSIFRVPNNLKDVEREAYIPQLVSIGPYHQGKARLKEMEKHKWRLLKQALERTGHQVEFYYEAMSTLEEKMRRCYAQPFENIDSLEFVEMMLLDACFVVELLNASDKGFTNCGYSWGDPIFTSRGALPCIKRDMLMLENQIPLFVLDHLYTLTCNPDETNSLRQLSLQFFDSVIPGCQNLHPQATNSEEPVLHLLHVVHGCLRPSSKAIFPRNLRPQVSTQKRGQTICFPRLHLLHVVRQCLLPTSKATFPCNPRPQGRTQERAQTICSPTPVEVCKEHQPQQLGHSVMMLRGSGVRFQKKDSRNFMDIEFKKGILYIPPLVIHDSTMSIFLNLMAFEQCYTNCSNHFTSYIRFMDGLINSHRDVEYLRYKGIIDHKLGSEQEVARLVNKFCKEIAFDIGDCYLSGVYDGVNEYFDQKWHVWRAILKQEYFTNPWAIVSILAASILLGLTLFQTIYTVITYYYK